MRRRTRRRRWRRRGVAIPGSSRRAEGSGRAGRRAGRRGWTPEILLGQIYFVSKMVFISGKKQLVITQSDKTMTFISVHRRKQLKSSLQWQTIIKL